MRKENHYRSVSGKMAILALQSHVAPVVAAVVLISHDAPREAVVMR